MRVKADDALKDFIWGIRRLLNESCSQALPFILSHQLWIHLCNLSYSPCPSIPEHYVCTYCHILRSVQESKPTFKTESDSSNGFNNSPHQCKLLIPIYTIQLYTRCILRTAISKTSYRQTRRSPGPIDSSIYIYWKEIKIKGR